MTTFGNILKSLRADKGVTQKQVATALNISRDTYANWEVNRGSPSLDMLDSIAEYFEVSADYLLGRDKHKTHEAQITYICPGDNPDPELDRHLMTIRDTIYKAKDDGYIDQDRSEQWLEEAAQYFLFKIEQLKKDE